MKTKIKNLNEKVHAKAQSRKGLQCKYQIAKSK
jgi:hypothetical protein